MAFGIALQDPTPDDAYLRARAGMPVLPQDDATAPAVGSALPAQQQSMPGLSKPSFMDILQGVLFDGQSPAEAAMAARQRQYQLQTQQVMMDTLRKLPDDQRIAMLTNPAKFGEAMASHVQDMVMKGGDTRNGGIGRPGFTAPMLGFDPVSGRGYTQTADTTTPTGATLGGGFKAENGVISSDRTGGVSGTYSLPQIVAPGSVPNTFTPTVGGPQGAPASPSGGPAAATSTSAPAGIRNNNFGNVKTPPAGPWQGQIGTDAQGHAIFDTAENGVRAAKANLESYAKNDGINTVGGLVARWAGSQASPQSLANYATYLSGALHVAPDQKIDLTDPKVQQPLLKGIFAFENGPATMAAWRGTGTPGKSASPQAATGSSSAPGFSGPAAKQPSILDPADPANARIYNAVPAGTVLQKAADGTISVMHEPEYSPAARGELRGKFMDSEPYKQHISASSALSALTHNIGQMSGPAAYTILDTMARTINPGAVARQGTIAAIEDMFGVPAHVTGSLLNIQGKGKIPLKTQQQIMNAVVPFAQSHYDQAKSLYDANSAIATAHGFDPREITAPIGNRPMGVLVTGAPPPPNQRNTNTVYVTPRGPMTWTGTGWLPSN